LRPTQPIPFWLLDRLGLDPAITGDILEEWAQGHSTIWYWRQILSVLRVAIWEAILDHKLLAVRAVATGCAMNYALMFVFEHFSQYLTPLTPNASFRTWISGLSLILLIQTVTGWVVARTHRAQPVPMVTAFAIFLMLWAIVLASADSYLRMLLVDSLDQPRFRPYLLRYLAPISAALFSHLVGLYSGGILGGGRKMGVSGPAPQ
jgi:hypothetical protein